MDSGNLSMMELRFVSGLESTYNKDIRAFVLQKYMAKRKKRAYARNRAKTQHEESNLQDMTVIGPSSWRDTEVGGCQAGSAQNDCGPLINTRLGMGRVDPFRTYARDTSSFENAMIDEYLTNVYTWFGLRRSQSFCPSRDLMFQNNIKDEVTVLAMIAYGASTYERRRGVPSRVSTKYHAMTIRILNERLQREFESPGDSLLVAVCGLICLTTETRSKQATREEIAEMMAHTEGLRALIATRGGWSFIRTYSPCYLSWLIIWVDVLLGGAVSAGSTITSQHIYSAPSLFHRHPKIPYEAANPRLHYPEELIGAYGDFYRAALKRHRSPQESPCQRTSLHKSPCDLFKPGMPSHRLLRSTEFIQIRRIAPLVFINVMLWNYRNCPGETLDELHDRYAKKIAGSDVDLAGSNEVLLWGLMTDVNTKRLVNLDWIELMTRMQWVEARLALRTQERLAETLLEFILRASQPEDLEVVAKWWTPEQFAEVVRAELSNSLRI